METLALAVVLNHETADGGRRSLFITYAVEIEGDTPLTFFPEAVDD